MDVGWWALIVSGLSFGLSGYVVWRDRTPKPKWVLEWNVLRVEGAEVKSVRASATNRGRGVARDVVLRTVALDGARSSYRMNTPSAAFSEALSLSFHVGDAPPKSEPRSQGMVILSGFTNDYFGQSVAVELEWSEEPHLHKRQSKRINYTLP